MSRFSPPRLRRTLLDRPRLIDRLHANVGTGLAVLQAPAGSGKTTLVASFTHEVDYNVRWLSLDASCVSPEVTAVQLASALLGPERSWDPVNASKCEDLKAYLSTVLTLAREESELPLMLVLDNIHELRECEEPTEIVAWVLENLGDGAEVILCGREAAPLREVDRRVAAGECLFLGCNDLAFDEDEVTRLVEETHSALAADTVLAATKGWPIAAMAMVHGTISPAGAQSVRGTAWDRFLASEVWRAVPAPLRDTMLRLSVLPIIDGDVAAEVAGDGAWDSLREWLVGNDFLCEVLENGAVRLNPLLRRFVAGEYEAASPDAYRSDVERATRWLERRGQVADAIELARTPGSEAVLAGLVQRCSRDLLLQGAFGLLWRGYQAIPEHLLEERPLLRAIGSRILAHQNLPQEALAAADAIIEDSEAPGAARFHAVLGRARALRLLGNAEELEQLFDGIHSTIECDDPSLSAELAWQEAQTVLAANSDFARAERLLLSCITHARQTNAATLELLAQSTLGQLHTMQGDGPRAVVELTRAAQEWRSLRGTGNLGWVLNNLGMAHLLVGDFESALSTLEQARQEGVASENARNEAYAIASLGDANLALGEPEKARVLYEEAIRLCATDALDQSLAALSITGFASALLGLGDVQQADFFARRALLVAETFENPFEVASCQLTLATVEAGAKNHSSAIALAREAMRLFESLNARSSLQIACYRLAMFLFAANRKAEAQEALKELDGLVTEPWMGGVLLPMVREQPMFAQWAASRALSGRWFRDVIERQAFSRPEPEQTAEPAGARLPRVVATSLGTTHVTVGGRAVTDQAWASVRAKEMFYLFLAHRSGLRKERAVEILYPEIPSAKCNSAFHSNLYRLRRALYAESVVKQDGSYVLNPEAEFEWDVEQFEAALTVASRVEPGSEERARRYEEALAYYRGPFAEEFHSEWADALRLRVEQESQQALSSLAGYHAARQDFESAADCLNQLLERDRYNEDVAYELARYRAKAGEAAAALAFLDTYRRSFESELGEQLPERFRRLRRDIAAGVAI
jgi:ATP/maltotriose-dependent transcriptional regulator MalT/DNA-binding SARP family transcriptional activator